MPNIIHIQSFKSGGATTLALNLAVYHAQMSPEQRVALCQVDKFPDIETYCGLKESYTYGDMARFWEEGEWSPEVVAQCRHSYHGTDIFCSPFGDEWDAISKPAWQKIVKQIQSEYDVIYLDMPWYMSDEIRSQWDISPQQSWHIITPTPGAIEIIKQSSDISNVLLNQCPKGKATLIKSWLGDKASLCQGVLPIENDGFWDQIYEGFPIVLQPKSPWTKEIAALFTHISNSS